jgi:uncharacterized protein (DUF2235 family)
MSGFFASLQHDPSSEEALAKNIIIFSDGTGQDGGVRAEQRMSNIYKMYRACRVSPETNIDPTNQVAYYDPGLGTETTVTGMTGLVRWVQKTLASVSGRGITTNIVDCYEFLINHYEPGDRIFLFGFSRGAYTARSIANLLMLCGVPTRHGDQPLQRFRKSIRDIAHKAVHDVLEHGAGHPRGKFEDERLELARRFRAEYRADHKPGEAHRSNAAPYFIGVFDTVAALGVKGALAIAIKVSLVAGTGVFAAVLSIVPSLAIAGILFLLGFAFWWSVLALVVAAAVLGGALMFWRQRKSVRKVIRDFPNPGNRSSHLAEWKGEHFDRLLSRFVGYARSANAIDETREDFARVPWGPTAEMQPERNGIPTFKQIWFAGNHSDIGGSYPETESRLSDVALWWMIEEAVAVPNGLKIGPVMVRGNRLVGTAEVGTPLQLFPAADGLQHCEVAGMQDLLDGRIPRWLRQFTIGLGWKAGPRPINKEAIVHPTVEERFRLEEVLQCAGSGAYRPAALKEHVKFSSYYDNKAA